MDIFQILYLILVILSVPIIFTISYFLYKRYKESKNQKSLYIAKAFLIFGIGATLLIVEQLVMTIAFPTQASIVVGSFYEDLARVLVCLAIFMVAYGLWYLNKFSIDFLSEKNAKLIYIIGPLAFIHAILYAIFPYHWYLTNAIYEFAHDVEPWHGPTLIFFYLVPVWFSPIVLYIATFKIRKEKRIVFMRSLTISLGILIGAFGYSVQVVAPSIISGASFFLMPLITYIGFVMPTWYKKFLKIQD